MYFFFRAWGPQWDGGGGSAYVSGDGEGRNRRAGDPGQAGQNPVVRQISIHMICMPIYNMLIFLMWRIFHNQQSVRLCLIFVQYLFYRHDLGLTYSMFQLQYVLFQDTVRGLEGHGHFERSKCSKCRILLPLVQMYQGTNSWFQWYVQ